jgi:glycosyltransferase involved in cell wall biosynthesis
MRVLMATPGPPSAGGKGFQVRLYNQILGLAARHSITLLSFSATRELEPAVVEACEKVVAVPWSAAAGAWTALANSPRLPLSVGLYHHPSMVAAIRSEIAGGRHDLVQLVMVRMAPYLRETAGKPVVLDLLDAAELNMRERARAAAPGIRQLLEVEARRLGAYERAAIQTANLSLLISQRDLSYLGNPSKARVLPNGIDPVTVAGDPPVRAPATMVFSGTMSYFPNADAATWFASEILPLVRAAVPSAVFRVAGREPAPAVKRLASQPGITVTGAVPDVAVELARASVSVCPMRFGSGMQTKILEAMAAGTPVVATTKGMEGIPEDLHRYLHHADSPATFAAEVSRILKQPGPALELAREGLAAIRREHTWRHSVGRLEVLYEEAIAAARQ